MFYRLKMEYLIYIYLDVKFSDLGIDFKHFLKINMIGKSQKYDTQWDVFVWYFDLFHTNVLL